MNDPTPSNRLRRRGFLGAAAVAGIAPNVFARTADTPALLGGTPVRKAAFPSWPILGENDLAEWVAVLKSGVWNQLSGRRVATFESSWAERLKVKHAVATANGTSALFTGLNALEIGPGDEVIVPPYTFVATVNAVLLQHALPIFVDTDPETLQIDASKVESALTDRTRCLLPAHIGGSPADLDTLLKIAKARNLPLIEDACQAHLAEWRGRPVGGLGTLGCFSFQASKNLNSGEGGAVVTDDDRLDAECRSFRNNGRAQPGSGHLFGRNGCNLRLTEFQGTLLSTQMTRLEAQAKTRDSNAVYLSSLLREIPGLAPARMYEGCTRNAYHLYMFRYDAAAFAGLPRAKFLKALDAEGIPASGGYTPLPTEGFYRRTLESRAYRSIYSEKRLAEALEIAHNLPGNDRACSETVWLTQTMLLGGRSDMDQIAEAARKIQSHASALNRAG